MSDPAPRRDASPSRAWTPIPGPSNRVTFLEEQRRHRRATWRAVALYGLAVAVMGIGVSTVLSPLVGLLALLCTRLASLVVPIPDAVWEPFRAFVAVFDQLISAVQSRRFSIELIILNMRRLGILLLPGTLAIVLLWLALHTLFRRAGVGGVVLGLNAREPRVDDLEEQQLVNVAQELALAAGIPPPRLMLLDATVSNAAVIGSSPGDATLIVSRRLLDEFNRDETQGVLGHLIASTSNGDLRITLATLSLLQTFGLLMTMLDVPLSARARAGLARLARFILRRHRGTDPALEADWVRAILTRSLDPDSITDIGGVIEETDRPSIGWFHRALLYARMFLLLPFLLAGLLAKLYLFLFTLSALGPTIWTTLRTRRYLADATAVQLTRNPDGLASALIALNESGGVVKGAEWASCLFVTGINPRQIGTRAGPKVGARWIRSQPKASSRADGPPGSGRPAAEPFLLIGAHPPLHARLKRLRALGASIQAADDPSVSSKGLRGKFGSVDLLKLVLAILIVGPILILFLSFFLYLLAVAVMASALLFGGLILLVMRLLPHLLPP